GQVGGVLVEGCGLAVELGRVGRGGRGVRGECEGGVGRGAERLARGKRGEGGTAGGARVDLEESLRAGVDCAEIQVHGEAACRGRERGGELGADLIAAGERVVESEAQVHGGADGVAAAAQLALVGEGGRQGLRGGWPGGRGAQGRGQEEDRSVHGVLLAS